MPDTPLLLIGGRGFIGEHLYRAADGAFRMFRGSRAEPQAESDVRIDITDPQSVDAAFERSRAQIVVLLAAVSDIDVCEREPEFAERVNVHGAEHVARACAKAGARLIYLSSAAVFDGAEHGYHEDHPLTPVGVYGWTKARAEGIVASVLDSAVVVRLPLVLGFAAGGGSNSLLNRLSAEWRAGRAVAFPTFEFRNAIDAPTLSRLLLELAQNQSAKGVYHTGAVDSLSRYELGLQLADRMGIARDLVRPQHTLQPGRAPRGRDHFLLTDRLRSVCRTPLPNMQQVLERCFDGTA